MQIVDTEVTDCVSIIAMQVNQCLETVLLTGIKEPIDRTLTRTTRGINLAMILKEIIQEIIPDDFTAGCTLITKCVCNGIKIAFKRRGIFHDKFGILKDEITGKQYHLQGTLHL